MKIRSDYLKVMLLFAAEKGVRYYMNGVYIKGDRMYATDGACLTVCKLEGDSGLDVIIPSKEIRVALQLLDSIEGFPQTIEVTADRIGQVFYKPIYGKYPNVTEVIPKPFDVMDAKKLTFNADYLSRYAKMSKIICGGAPNKGGISIKAKDELSAANIHVFGCDDFFSILMPMRNPGAEFWPHWIADTEEVTA